MGLVKTSLLKGMVKMNLTTRFFKLTSYLLLPSSFVNKIIFFKNLIKVGVFFSTRPYISYKSDLRLMVFGDVLKYS